MMIELMKNSDDWIVVVDVVDVADVMDVMGLLWQYSNIPLNCK